MINNILILGGFGFIGTNLVEELLRRGNRNLIIFESKSVKIQNPSLLHQVKVYYGDFNNEKDIEAIFRENPVDLVIHLISTTTPSNENVIYDINTNLINTIKLLDLMRRFSVKKIIFPSSGGVVYGVSEKSQFKESNMTNPVCSYGIIKLTIEKYLQQYKYLYDIDYLILRPSNPFGEYHNSTKQGFINVALNNIVNHKKITIWGDGSVIRDYIYIKDVVKIITELIDQGISNEIFNIGSGIGYSLNDLLKIFQEKIGTFEIEHIISRKFDLPCVTLNVEKVQSFIKNLKHTPIEEGIIKTYNWLKQNSNKNR